MKVGFIGFGEAAYELSSGLSDEGLKEMVAYDNCSKSSPSYKLLEERAGKIGVHLMNTPQNVLSKSDLIFVAVPSQYAIQVCNSIKPEIKSNHLYVDVSASTPKVKQEINHIVSSNNGKFVDGAMLGPLTVHRHKVPLMASGSGSQKFIEQMTPYGMNIEYISENAGDASSIKLLRSIYMKGIAALLIELLEASVHMNLEKPVLESIGKTIDESTFEQLINQLITGTSIHALRRSYELEGSLKMLDNLNLNSELTVATKKKLEYVSSLELQNEWGNERPKEWKTVINKILEINKEKE